MEKLVLTVRFVFALVLQSVFIVGCVIMSLAVVAKKYNPKTKQIDDCWGCFGAAMGDCDHCPVKGGENNE